ncbi:hypothetical protein KY328_00635 [Candidatus Woesearchaeota archaeon]|nr:hypothetical protein [Candidatus Woesearchaeota archaeon]MBW3021403.1 hypothetical protein [Candidatus Woesearchaeota archaeon]
MVKMHTRQKRKLGRGKGTSFRMRYKSKGIKAPNRPKTFATEENAKKYAASQGIKKFSLKKVKKGKRFQVVEEKA